MTDIQLHSLATVTAFVAFLAICWWAFNPRNRKRFEDDARQAIDDDQHTQAGQLIQEQKSARSDLHD